MATCRVADGFSTILKLIWPKSSLKNAKMSKKRRFFAKSSGAQWVKKKDVLAVLPTGFGKSLVFLQFLQFLQW